MKDLWADVDAKARRSKDRYDLVKSIVESVKGWTFRMDEYGMWIAKHRDGQKFSAPTDDGLLELLCRHSKFHVERKEVYDRDRQDD